MPHSGLSNLMQEISAPPDRGLASQQMSGKKLNKFHIIVRFLSNADGSEKWVGCKWPLVCTQYITLRTHLSMKYTHTSKPITIMITKNF